jgi:hypothetical protein
MKHITLNLPECEYLMNDTSQGPYIGLFTVSPAKSHFLAATRKIEQRILAAQVERMLTGDIFSAVCLERIHRSVLIW